MIEIDRFDDPDQPLAWQRIIRTRMSIAVLNILLLGCVLAAAAHFGGAARHF